MSGLASLFPPPPAYYKRFTADAWTRVKELEHSGQIPQGSDAELFPPLPPDATEHPVYRNFGSLWNVENGLPSLKDSGITQLYPDGTEQDSHKLADELQKLLRSVLVQFLGLVQTLHSDAVQFPARIEDLRTTLVNMHHLINTYRPLQNQESLAIKMQTEIASIREATENAKQTNAHARELLDRVEKMLETVTSKQSLPQQDTDWDAFSLNINL